MIYQKLILILIFLISVVSCTKKDLEVKNIKKKKSRIRNDYGIQ